jgi:hypothetical protein
VQTKRYKLVFADHGLFRDRYVELTREEAEQWKSRKGSKYDSGILISVEAVLGGH